MLLNTLLLTATAILMRTVGMVFQVYLSKKIGASGIGLFQLILSVSMLAACFAISGVRFATTRLVAEELGRGGHGGVRAAVRRCLVYALCFGTAAAVLLNRRGHDRPSRIGDAPPSCRCAFGLSCRPAMSAVLSGYFTAVTRVIKVAACRSSSSSYVSRRRRRPDGPATRWRPPAHHRYRGVAGEAFSFILLYILYVFDRALRPRPVKRAGLTKRFLKISLPLPVSAYGRTALPPSKTFSCRSAFGSRARRARRPWPNYGYSGDVFPIIASRTRFFYSISELIVPELTEAQVNGRTQEISNKVAGFSTCASSFLRVTRLFPICRRARACIYQNDAVGHYIRALAFLMPVIFLDSVADGMLRGLGQQMHVMRYNILDSFLSVILVYFLLPIYAVPGFIFMIYFTDLFNFTLSIHRLRVITKFRLPFKQILSSLVCAWGSVSLESFFTRIVGLAASPTAWSLHV
jgi:stage V sporulation protein B